MKIVTMHQPNYLPWIGFFSKIKQSDCFILADTFEIGKQSVVHRNKIRTNSGWSYLTVPLGRRIHGTRICEITLPSDDNWKSLHWTLIHNSYAKTKFFDSYKDILYGIYKRNFQYLCHMSTEIITYLMHCFDIDVEILKASEMGIDPSLHQTDAIIAALKNAGADIYLSGPSGRNYLEFEKFSQNNIILKFFKFNHPIYTQRFTGFEPNMCALDLLFNMGPESSEIIAASGNIGD